MMTVSHCLVLGMLPASDPFTLLSDLLSEENRSDPRRQYTKVFLNSERGGC
jgi:hypothetical protein